MRQGNKKGKAPTDNLYCDKYFEYVYDKYFNALMINMINTLIW